VGLSRRARVSLKRRFLPDQGSARRDAAFVIRLLVLIPSFAFRVLGEALGEGKLPRMFFVDRELK
jgi:hypothetical protein